MRLCSRSAPQAKPGSSPYVTSLARQVDSATRALDDHQFDRARLPLRGSRGILLLQALREGHLVPSAIEPLDHGWNPRRRQVHLAAIRGLDLDLIAPLSLMVGSMEGLVHIPHEVCQHEHRK